MDLLSGDDHLTGDPRSHQTQFTSHNDTQLNQDDTTLHASIFPNHSNPNDETHFVHVDSTAESFVAAWFHEADADRDGRVADEEARTFLLRSGLAPAELSTIWRCVKPPGSVAQQGKGLTHKRFSQALRLIALTQSGQQVTSELAQLAIDPDAWIAAGHAPLPSPTIDPVQPHGMPHSTHAHTSSITVPFDGNHAATTIQTTSGNPFKESTDDTRTIISTSFAALDIATSRPVSSSPQRANSKTEATAPSPVSGGGIDDDNDIFNLAALRQQRSMAATTRTATVDALAVEPATSTSPIVSPATVAAAAAAAIAPQVLQEKTPVSYQVRYPPLNPKASSKLSMICAAKGALFAGPSINNGLLQWSHTEGDMHEPGVMHGVRKRSLGRLHADLRVTHTFEKSVPSEDGDAVSSKEILLTSRNRPITCTLIDDVRSILWIGDREGWISGYSLEVHASCNQSNILGGSRNRSDEDGILRSDGVENDASYCSQPIDPDSTRLFHWQAHRVGHVTAIAIGPLGEVWTGSNRGALRVWMHTTSKAVVSSSSAPPKARELRRNANLRAHSQSIVALACSADGQITWSASKASIALWDSASGAFLGILLRTSSPTSIFPTTTTTIQATGAAATGAPLTTNAITSTSNKDTDALQGSSAASLGAAIDIPGMVSNVVVSTTSSIAGGVIGVGGVVASGLVPKHVAGVFGGETGPVDQQQQQQQQGQGQCSVQDKQAVPSLSMSSPSPQFVYHRRQSSMPSPSSMSALSNYSPSTVVKPVSVDDILYAMDWSQTKGILPRKGLDLDPLTRAVLLRPPAAEVHRWHKQQEAWAAQSDRGVAEFAERLSEGAGKAVKFMGKLTRLAGFVTGNNTSTSGTAPASSSNPGGSGGGGNNDTNSSSNTSASGVQGSDTISDRSVHGHFDEYDAWQEQPSQPQQQIFTGGMLVSVVTTSDNAVWAAFDRGRIEKYTGEGRLLWSLELGGKIKSIAPVGSRKTWVGFSNGMLCVLSSDGAILTTFQAHSSSIIGIAQSGRRTFTLAVDGSIHGWCSALPSPSDEDISRAWHESSASTYSREDINLLAVTWNCGESRPDSGSAFYRWLKEHGFDKSVAVIGLQEVEMGGTSVALAAAKDAISYRLQEKGNANAQFWSGSILSALGGQNHWHQVALRQLSGMLIVVFARNNLRGHIGEIATASVACGVLGVGGNKGAVAVEFTLYRQKFLCICSHFAAHQHAVEGRNANYSSVCKHLTFTRKSWMVDEESDADGFVPVGRLGGGPSSLIRAGSISGPPLSASTTASTTFSSGGGVAVTKASPALGSTQPGGGTATVMDLLTPDIEPSIDIIDAMASPTTTITTTSAAAAVTMPGVGRASSSDDSDVVDVHGAAMMADLIGGCPDDGRDLYPGVIRTTTVIRSTATLPGAQGQHSAPSTPTQSTPAVPAHGFHGTKQLSLPRTSATTAQHVDASAQWIAHESHSLRNAQAVVWLGDFNYRIDGQYDQVKHLAIAGEYAPLYVCDQLQREVAAGRVFRGFREPPMNFPPTYKFDKGVASPMAYDSSEKKRVPAWCDRIFYRGSLPFGRPSPIDQQSNIRSATAAAAAGGGGGNGGNGGDGGGNGGDDVAQRQTNTNNNTRSIFERQKQVLEDLKRRPFTDDEVRVIPVEYGCWSDVYESDHRPVYSFMKVSLPVANASEKRAVVNRIVTKHPPPDVHLILDDFVSKVSLSSDTVKLHPVTIPDQIISLGNGNDVAVRYWIVPESSLVADINIRSAPGAQGHDTGTGSASGVEVRPVTGVILPKSESRIHIRASVMPSRLVGSYSSSHRLVRYRVVFGSEYCSCGDPGQLGQRGELSFDAVIAPEFALNDAL